MDYCKENPGTVQMGNSGMGAIWHVATVQMEKEFGIEVKHIPYPNGTADIAAALTGGHIDGTLADPSSFVSQVQAGTLKILPSWPTSVPSCSPTCPLSRSWAMT